MSIYIVPNTGIGVDSKIAVCLFAIGRNLIYINLAAEYRMLMNNAGWNNIYTLIRSTPNLKMGGKSIRTRVVVLLFPLWLSLSACDLFDRDDLSANGSVQGHGQYKSIEWTDLMPDADLQALMNPPDYLFEIEEGSEEDQRMLEKLASGKAEDLDRYQRALTSEDIRTEFDGAEIRLAGYLVPLEYDSAEVVTQAFLVPYFGACIHVPPPPPNQMVLLNARDGLSLNDMYNPHWVSGKLSAKLYENELGTSAYEMTVDKFELYTE